MVQCDLCISGECHDPKCRGGRQCQAALCSPPLPAHEIERLRAELDHAVTNETLLRHDVQRQAATIADLTAALRQIKYLADDPVRIVAEAALDRAQTNLGVSFLDC